MPGGAQSYDRIGSKSRYRESLELVVDTEANRVERNVVLQAGKVVSIEGCLAKVRVEIFGLQRDIVRHRVFDACADSPAPLGVLFTNCARESLDSVEVRERG